MEKLLPTLSLLGIKNIWVLRVKKEGDIKPQVLVLKYYPQLAALGYPNSYMIVNNNNKP